MEADPDRTTFSKLAEPILDRPHLFPHLVLIYEAFRDLSSERQSGFGVGPIPWSAIIHYATWVGFTSREEQRWFKRRVQALDNEYLRLTNNERKEQEEFRKQEADRKEEERKKAAL